MSSIEGICGGWEGDVGFWGHGWMTFNLNDWAFSIIDFKRARGGFPEE